MNHRSFEDIQNLLNKSLILHDTLISSQYPPFPIHVLRKQIQSLQFWTRELKRYTNSSVLFKQYVEAEAFRFALDNSRDFCDVKCTPCYKDRNSERLERPDSYEITAWYRMVCGEQEMKEYYQVQWKCICKDEVEIYGLPKLLSNWIVDPESWEIIDKDLPDEDVPEHQPDCEYYLESDWIVRVYDQEKVVDEWTIDANRTESQATREAEAEIDQLKPEKFTDWTLTRDAEDFGMCMCSEYDYYHTEEYIVDDFISNSIQYLLEYELPEATFDPDTRSWQLGFMEFDLNEYETNEYYRSSADYSNGAPYTN